MTYDGEGETGCFIGSCELEVDLISSTRRSYILVSISASYTMFQPRSVALHKTVNVDLVVAKEVFEPQNCPFPKLKLVLWSGRIRTKVWVK